mmetsp:Transcript_20360/g.33577  ORF Transcript_20360/g.33577 Transcript_20360/m.33577 type:complete len:587 (-) Transcript_20360:59-1819(-)|eukprot:CAMPEP_0203784578 /NCGR_PEP_ID=MMETSP0100_2-20121128/538_1 /ASSEMBLY_ACC=CAM_ASM_000210 /TAXON_ID=96639 /ORGANISM=" , Strain NY0313808BC1" /LENGTH=586 /DNA_ID=CAMNT_0050686563 /DNA_START=296 /DNA_END=2056 /DNA_ORIENTATION=-
MKLGFVGAGLAGVICTIGRAQVSVEIPLFGKSNLVEYYTVNSGQGPPCPRDFCGLEEDDSCPVDRFAVKPLLEYDFRQIKKTLEKQRQQLAAPSLVLSIVQGGGHLFSSYHGHKSSDTDSKHVSGDSRYLIGSISKLFTSVMLFQIRDMGLLPKGLDTEVRDIFPGYQDPQMLGSSKRGITLRALATHASGLIRDFDNEAGLTEGQALDAIAKSKPMFPQFTKTAYSNVGVALLGRALSKVAGMTWEEWVATKIMKPLRMKNSGPVGTEESDLVTGHDPVTRADANITKMGWSSPAGSVFSTANDMSLFMLFLLGDHSHGHNVLDSASVAEMLNTGQVMGDGMSYISSGTFESMRIHDRVAMTKAGCLDGYRSDIMLIPSMKLGIFTSVASTCDLLGDGDVVSFPIAMKLIKRLKLIFGTYKMNSIPMAPTQYTGTYCNPDYPARIRLSTTLSGTPVLLMENGPGGDQRIQEGLPFTLHSVSPLTPDVFRLEMGTQGSDYLSKKWRSCTNPKNKKQNLCPLSCNRRMGRGDLAMIRFKRDIMLKIVGFEVIGGGLACDKISSSLDEDVSSNVKSWEQLLGPFGPLD